MPVGRLLVSVAGGENARFVESAADELKANGHVVCVRAAGQGERGLTAHRSPACVLRTTFVDKILRGAKLANLPVEQPTNQLVENRQTLGLSNPQSVLLRVEEVTE